MQTSEMRVATSNVMWKLNVITKLIFNLIYYWVISLKTRQNSAVLTLDQKEEVSKLSKWESGNYAMIQIIIHSGGNLQNLVKRDIQTQRGILHCIETMLDIIIRR